MLNKLDFKRLFVVFFILLGLYHSANATSIAGSEITYECIAPNQYLVTVNQYRDCNEALLPANIVCKYSSSACGISASLTLNRVSVTDITPTCASTPTACGGGGTLGREVHVYEGVLNLPYGCGNDWRLSISDCCRSNAITNLNNPETNGYYIETRLNNTLSQCNNSPVFASDAQIFGCVGQTIKFDQLATDIDGDLLIYSLTNARRAPSTNVTYAGGFSGSNPFTSPVTVNPTTGLMTFTPATPQVAVVSILIEEFRSGVFIGEIIRDIEVVITNCANTIPALSGIDGNAGVFSITACEGTTVCFDILATDANGAQSLTTSWSDNIPGATFTPSGSGTSITNTFCWDTEIGDDGTYVFSVSAEDNACPLIGQNSQTYTINILENSNNPVNAGSDVSICSEESTVLVSSTSATNVTSYSWTPTLGLTAPNSPNTTATPEATTNYTITALYDDGCTLSDDVNITVVEDPVANVFPTTAFACAGANFTLLGTTDQTGYSFQWFGPTMNFLGSGTVSGTQSSIILTLPGTPGTYTYTLRITNPITGCISEDVSNITIGSQPSGAICNNIYVSTTGSNTAAGTQANPTNLTEALSRSSCNNTVIKMATGTYSLNSALYIPSFVTIEGGFDQGNAWRKTSLPGATTINRTTSNPEGSIYSRRLVAFYGNSVSGFRFQDVTITTSNANQNGMTTYGVHLTNCSDYDFIRTQIFPGNGGVGFTGNNGSNGANGSNGSVGTNGDPDDDGQNDNGHGGRGGNGAGPGGAGAPIAVDANGQAGGDATSGSRNGGGGGAGGAGGWDGSPGDDAFDGGGGGQGGIPSGTLGPQRCGGTGQGGNGGNGGNPGGAGATGFNGYNGGVGAVGTVGPAGTHVGSFFIPGAAGGTGGAGAGGSGGCGGGGGGPEICFTCNDGAGNGGSGGGGGGQGGAGGYGGRGGGGSFGLYLTNNGANGIVSQSRIIAGNAGAGGSGGNGGNGGNGGSGGAPNTYQSSEIGSGGRGGNGGAGGTGGRGGNGRAGSAISVYLGSGSALALNSHVFNLAGQTTITASNVNCTNTNVNYTTTSASTWDFDRVTNNATPATSGVASSVNTQYTAIARYTLSRGPDIYEGFHNISYDGSIVPIIETSAPMIGVDTFKICQGDFATFGSAEIADSYVWNLNGAIANPGSGVQSFTSQFNNPGFYEITLRFTTDCCGLSSTKSVYLYVLEVPTVTGSGNGAICEGETRTLTLSGLAASDSVVWSPTSNIVSSSANTITVSPSSTTTYIANIYTNSTAGGQSILGCPITLDFTVTVNPISEINFTSNPETCNNDGSATATPSIPGNYNFVWSNGATTFNAATSTTTGLASGNYSVTATNTVTGCSNSGSVLVNSSAPQLYLVSNSVECFGESDGSASVNVSGGTPPYDYVWSNGYSNINIITNSTSTGLTAGNYTVYLTDVLGCTSTLTFNVPENPELTYSVTNNSPVCSGDDAIFTLTGNAGATITYNLGAGDVSVTLYEDDLEVTIPAATSDQVMTLVSIDDGVCNRSLSATSTITVSGSNGSFTDTICANSTYTLPSGLDVFGPGVYNDIIPGVPCDSSVTVTLVSSPSSLHYGLYAASISDYQQINPLTGTVLNTYSTTANSLGWTNGAFTIHEQAATLYWVSDQILLQSLDLTNGVQNSTATAINTLPSFWGLRYYNGYLYTITTSGDNDKMLVRINPSTGALDASFPGIEINGTANNDILVHSSIVINPINGRLYILLDSNILLEFDIAGGSGNVLNLSGYVNSTSNFGLLEINEFTGEMYAIGNFNNLVRFTITGPTSASVALVKTLTSASGYSNPISTFDSDNELFIFQASSGCSQNPLVVIDVNTGQEWCTNPPGLAFFQLEYLNCKPSSNLRVVK